VIRRLARIYFIKWQRFSRSLERVLGGLRRW
jgi:hypothetical protein